MIRNEEEGLIGLLFSATKDEEAQEKPFYSCSRWSKVVAPTYSRFNF